MDIYLPAVDGVINTMRNQLLNYPDWVDATAVAPASKGYKEVDPYKITRYRACRIPFVKVDFGFPSLDGNFKKKIKDMDIDIIHLHSPFGICKYLTKVAKKRNIPIVQTFHSDYRYNFKKLWKMKMIYEPYIQSLGKRYNKMDEVFCASEATEKLVRSFGFTGRAKVLPLGSGMKMEQPLTQMQQEANLKWGLNSEDVVFCYVGRMVKSKRLDFVLQTMAEVKARGFKCKLFAVGCGPFAKQFKQQAHNLGLDEQIIFTGFASTQDLQLIYARSLMLLLATVMDTFGLVKVDAAAFETATMLLRGENASFGTLDGVNSVHFENTVEDFADKIIWAIENKDRVLQIGKKAKEDLFYSWKDSAEILAKEYKEVIARFKKEQKLLKR